MKAVDGADFVEQVGVRQVLVATVGSRIDGNQVAAAGAFVVEAVAGEIDEEVIVRGNGVGELVQPVVDIAECRFLIEKDIGIRLLKAVAFLQHFNKRPGVAHAVGQVRAVHVGIDSDGQQVVLASRAFVFGQFFSSGAFGCGHEGWVRFGLSSIRKLNIEKTRQI